jgi:hypothetical protein
MHFDNFDWTLLSSTVAIIIAKVSLLIVDSTSLMSLISGLSALAFCLTAILKFISYSMDEIPKIIKKWKNLKK